MSDTSMFSMEDATVVLQLALPAAKAHLEKIVNESTANRRNKAKALQSIQSAKSNRQLSTMVANFILAHPENGRMKVI